MHKMRASAPPPPTSPPAAAAGSPTRVVTSPSAPPPPEGWRETSTTYPPGLLSLMPLDRIFIHRDSGFMGTVSDEQRYRIKDSSGTEIFTAIEESSLCSRCCLGKCRAWDFHVVDKNGMEVFRISRDFRCESCCFPCCLQELTVKSDREVLGKVVQNWNMWRPSYTVRDSVNVPVLYVKGPICYFCPGDQDFLIKSIDKQHNVGVITKKWTGIASEFFREANIFGVGFPIDLDTKIKAVLIGACFLIDFVYFEEEGAVRRMNKW